jgi:hypothetical protein
MRHIAAPRGLARRDLADHARHDQRAMRDGALVVPMARQWLWTGRTSQ